jgi:antirestriction protein
MTTPRIYVACLASYNNGVLFGEWMDADDGEDTINEQIAALLRKSRYPNVMIECPECEGFGDEDCAECKGTGKVPSAEEFAIHDCEGFGGFDVGEYSPISDVCEAAELLAQHGEAFGVACDYFGGLEGAKDAMDRYAGAWDSAGDYAAQWAEDCGELANVPESIQHAIDWDRYADGMGLTEIRCNGKVHIFTEG